MSSVPFLMSNHDIEAGEIKGIENDFAYRNNVHQANIKIRFAFIRKVYFLLCVQLSITTAFGFLLMFWPKVRLYVHNNDWLLSVSIIASVFTLIALHMKRKSYPANLILLLLFTIVEAYSVGVFVTFFEQFLVLQALIMTAVVVASLTMFTFQTKRDFSTIGVVLYSGMCILIFGGILQVCFGSTTLELALSVGGSMLFSMFIVFDTQNLMKRLSPEEYILATINLYMDIINLFLYILRILQAARKN